MTNSPNDFGAMVREVKKCQTIYIAGPMRGIEFFNFPAFDSAKMALKEMGWAVISPADMDREAGFDPVEYFGAKFDPDDDEGPDSKDFWNYLPSEADNWNHSVCMRRDFDAIVERADAICMLPGWHESTGAVTEFYLSIWKGIPAFQYPSMDPVTLDQTYFAYNQSKKLAKEEQGSKDPLEEAISITSGVRNEQYGPPGDNHKRTADLWTTYKGVKFTVREVCMMNVLQKISRDAHSPKRDNLVDIPGFVRNIWMAEEGLG
jgi:hypothetical protein